MAELNKIQGALYAFGGGDPTDFDKITIAKQAQAIKYEDLKNKAQQWTTTQQMKLAKDGWEPVAKFPGGNPKDFQAMNLPGVGQYFKPVDAEEKAKQLIASTKVKAFEALDPAAKAEYALNGGTKKGAYQVPTFGQKQLIGSLKSAIKNGNYTYQNSMMGGRPTNMPIKTKADAMALITMKNLDPDLFQAELSKYDSKGNTETPPIDNLNSNW
jgi:hypothetical protein